MAAPHEDSTEYVLHAVSTKQDRLEKRIASLQEVVLNNFESLQQCVASLSIPSADQSLLTARNGDRLSIDELSQLGLVRQNEGNRASQDEGKRKQPSKEITTRAPAEGQPTLSKNASSLSLAAAHLSSRYDFYDKHFGGPPQSWRSMSFSESKRVRKSNEVIERASMGSTPSAKSTCSSVASSSLTSTLAYVGSFHRAAGKSARHTLVGTIDPHDPCLVNFVRHPLFQCLCGSTVILNSILVGITVEIEANYGANGNDLWEILSLACSSFFMVELIARMMAFGVTTFFCRAEDKYMNYFDTLLVLFSIADTITSITNSGGNSSYDMGQAFKTMRLMRILKIFRIFRFFHELSLMVAMILECLTSLFWAMVLLMIIMYSFAVIITQRAASYRVGNLDNPSVDMDNVEKLFGTMSCTCYFLFQTMLGGVSWGIVSDTLLQFDVWSAALYFFYIAFTMLAVLNIITGIFVDNALETSRMQREYIVKREEKAKHKTMKELAKIFDEMDEDSSGTITWDEMSTALDFPDTLRYFNALGLQCDDMRQLFDMMDDNCSGQIDLEEFLDGCSRCTGDAKSIDIHAILHDLRRLHKRLDLEGFMHHSDAPDNPNPGISNTTEKKLSNISQQVTDQVTGLMAGWSRALTIEFRQLRDLSRLIIQKVDVRMNEEGQSFAQSLDNKLFAESDGSLPITLVLPSLPVPNFTPPQAR